MSKHPYEEFEDTQIWEVCANAIDMLIENNDLQLTTRRELIIGLLCKEVSKLKIQDV